MFSNFETQIDLSLATFSENELATLDPHIKSLARVGWILIGCQCFNHSTAVYLLYNLGGITINDAFIQ